MIIFVGKLCVMTEEERHLEIEEQHDVAFEEHGEHPLEKRGFMKIPKRGDFPTMLDLIAMILIVVASQFIVSVIGVAMGFTVPDMLTSEITDVEQFIGIQVTRGQNMAVIYPLSMLLAFVTLLFYIRLRDGRGRVARSSIRGFNPLAILGGLIWLIAVQVVVEPISLLLPEAEQTTGRGFWAIMTAVVFAPVFEELIFRGLVLESLLRRHRRIVSVIVSSIIFALVHFQPAVMFSAAVSGFVLGTMYLHTNSIFSSIILHSINNAFAFTLIILNLDDRTYAQMINNDKTYHIVYIMAVAISIIGFVQTWRRRKHHGNTTVTYQ